MEQICPTILLQANLTEMLSVTNPHLSCECCVFAATSQYSSILAWEIEIHTQVETEQNFNN